MNLKTLVAVFQVLLLSPGLRTRNPKKGKKDVLKTFAAHGLHPNLESRSFNPDSNAS
jgi:hypothetical protein